MKKIALMDTSIFTYNLGDQIIMESVKEQILPMFPNDFILNIPTHTPICHKYEYVLDKILHKNNVKIKDLDYKFVCGTNLLTGNMLKIKNNWNMNIFDSYMIDNCILVGVGTNVNSDKINLYTKIILKNVLSEKYIHSVRDEKTKQFLENLGYNAINTGCCTLWKLTPDFCKKIPSQKSKNVVFTLTDYSKDIEKDQLLINILKSEYEKVYFWPQGLEDYEYFNSLDKISNITIIDPSLQKFEEFLNNNECDYIGTRLHGGIKAMQCKKRSIIIAIDNRARNMGRDYNLNIIERNDLNNLNVLINSNIISNVSLNFSAIKKWKEQFKSE